MKKTLAKTWTPTNNRFIAFFDYLGFSNFVLRNDHSSVLKRMEKIHGLLNDLNLESRGKYLTIGETDKDPISIGNYYSKATMFSDSFVIFSEDDSTNNLTHLLLQCIKFMQKCIYYGIPVKGAISHGNVTADVDKNIFLERP